jgi:anti-sigma B factor antagonist
MRLSEQLRRSHTILRVEGALKVGVTADAFCARVDAIIGKSKGALVLDLEALEYIDSTGVGALVGALKKFQAVGRQIILSSPQRRVLAGLRVTHLDTLFPIHPTLGEALASLSDVGEEITNGGH